FAARGELWREEIVKQAHNLRDRRLARSPKSISAEMRRIWIDLASWWRLLTTFGLPVLDGGEGMDQVDDVEHEIVADGDGEGEFDDQEERDRGPGWESGGEIEAEGGEEDVAEGI